MKGKSRLSEAENREENARDQAGMVSFLWHFFSSVKLALFLMLAITALSLPGALLVQVPRGVAADPQQYAFWLEGVRVKYGIWTPLLSFLGLLDVFRSPAFMTLGALLMVNILVCSLNRWKSLSLAMRGGPVKLGECFYSAGQNRRELSHASLVPQELAAIPSEILRKHHYRVRMEEAGGKVYLAADQNRYYRLGTYLSHLSLILFIPAFLIGSFFGFRNENFVVPEGAVREVGYGTGLSLKLESFVDEYYPDGFPKDYRSEVIIYDGGREVKRDTVRVNYPLGYNGVRFFQVFFGPAAMIEVRSSTGEVLLREGVALPSPLEVGGLRRYVGRFSLPLAGLRVLLLGSAVNAPDPMIKRGEMGVILYQGDFTTPTMDKLELGVPRGLGGLEFTYLGEGKYSGFQVSRDPGNILVWIASSLFILGISLVLYFPHRQVWVLIAPRAGGGSHLLVRSATPRSGSALNELEVLSQEIEGSLKKHKVRR